jgi:CHAT domain-containing protein
MILAENEYQTYHKIIHLAFQIFERTGDHLYKNKAFEYSEKSKSANLLAALRNSEALEIGGIPDDLIKREQEIRSELNSYELFVYEETSKEDPNEERIKIWEDYIFTLQTQFDSLISFLEVNYPEYHSLKFQMNVTDPAKISEALSKNKVLIEYVVLDSVLLAFIHAKDDFLIHREPIDSLFHFNTRFLRDIVTNRKFSEGVKLDYTRFVHASNNLYQRLIRPFEVFIEDKDLIIIPDGTLAYIPFEVLISQLPDYRELDYRGLQYLLRDHSVSYSNSATLLVNSMKKQKKANRKLLAFAPNYLNDLAPETSRTATEQLYESLYPIPGVLEEVSRIQKILGGDIYLDDEATEFNFKKNSSNFGILHFAMHTVLDDSNPMFSKLVFANVNENEEDGLLNTFEIYNLSLNAKMAVLSSCNSGAGKMLKGEGVMSLARGFIYAGCPSIIMTLWEVEDNSGSAIMSDFYGYLKKGYSKNDALRLAKLDFLENATMKFAHPYFWSPYVSIGDTEPIFQKLYLRILLLSLLVFVVVLLGGTLYRKLR